jgi:Leucine-rich repeat (LRR) protein
MKPRTEVKYIVRIECLVSEFKILCFIDLKQNNLIKIDGKIFQYLNHLNRLDVSNNNIGKINYSGLHRACNVSRCISMLELKSKA